MPALKDVVDLLHGWYPPATADSWDAVGLVCGHPGQRIEKVLFAVDPTFEVAREAVDWGADLLVVHHPLFLKPVHGFAATTPKGRTLATLAGAGCALLTAHTNADQAVGGVSEAMALALGLTDLAPILPAPQSPMDKLTVFVPAPDAERLRGVLADAGAGRIGDYDQASFSTPGEGRLRPRSRRRPAAYVSLATRTGRSSGWRCAGERATSCSTRSPRPTPTSTSRATCGTTRRASSPS